MSPVLTISVLLATCNSEKYLEEQLASLARQSRLPDELVVTDDRSTDGTLKILEDFRARAPFPVRIHRNETRLGYTDNFLSASSICKGDLIAFCDHDDVWREDKLALCLREFDRPGVQLVVHGTAEVDADLKLIGYQPAIKNSLVIRPLTEHQKLPWTNGCSEVVRREVVEEIVRRWPHDHSDLAKRFGGKLLSHDQAVFFVANGVGDIKFIAQPLIQHRYHGANITRTLPTLTGQLHLASAVGRDAYRKQARVLQAQARIMMRMAESGGNPVVTDALRRKAQSFMQAAAGARARARIYNERNLLRRIGLIVKAGRRGYYKPQLGLHGIRSMAKDLATALMRRERWLG